MYNINIIAYLWISFIRYAQHRSMERRKNMNVILINGSPNSHGCTYTALEEVSRTLQQEGIDTEIIHVGNKAIRGCIGCRKCKTTGQCVFDDLVNETAPKFRDCDGIVIGSPVYFASANGTLVSFIDSEAETLLRSMS